MPYGPGTYGEFNPFFNLAESTQRVPAAGPTQANAVPANMPTELPSEPVNRGPVSIQPKTQADKEVFEKAVTSKDPYAEVEKEENKLKLMKSMLDQISGGQSQQALLTAGLTDEQMLGMVAGPGQLNLGPLGALLDQHNAQRGVKTNFAQQVAGMDPQKRGEKIAQTALALQQQADKRKLDMLDAQAKLMKDMGMGAIKPEQRIRLTKSLEDSVQQQREKLSKSFDKFYTSANAVRNALKTGKARDIHAVLGVMARALGGEIGTLTDKDAARQSRETLYSLIGNVENYLRPGADVTLPPNVLASMYRTFSGALNAFRSGLSVGAESIRSDFRNRYSVQMLNLDPNGLLKPVDEMYENMDTRLGELALPKRRSAPQRSPRRQTTDTRSRRKIDRLL